MRTKKVVVLPYDETWNSAFEDIRREIEEAIGDLILGIEHVGSTAVKGLPAKPCIDLDVIIEDYSLLDDVIRKLEEISYFHEGDLGIKDREAFRYDGKLHLMTHHLYVCPRYSRELYRHIAFRDFLRTDHAAARKYGAVKETAARLFPESMDGYMAYKSSCIAQLYNQRGLHETSGCD